LSINKGIINLIKPVGITSFQAVKEVKKIINVKKAGHTGTLDLLATGVLPICFGRATKVIQYLNETKKEYIAEITIGKTTETLDREGKIVSKTNKWRSLTDIEIKEVVNSFIGEIKQIPPMYSAVHHNGKRLYKLARKGKEVKREPRNITIFYIEILKIDLPIIKLKIGCSKGTYIRALAKDIGDKLKVGAYLSFLIRTKSGPFDIEEAITFKEIKKNINNLDEFVSSLDFFLDYPSLNIKPESEKRAVNGVALREYDFVNEIKDYKKGNLILIYGPDNKFISINKVDTEDNEIIIKPERVFV